MYGAPGSSTSNCQPEAFLILLFSRQPKSYDLPWEGQGRPSAVRAIEVVGRCPWGIKDTASSLHTGHLYVTLFDLRTRWSLCRWRHREHDGCRYSDLRSECSQCVSRHGHQEQGISQLSSDCAQIGCTISGHPTGSACVIGSLRLHHHGGEALFLHWLPTSE